MWLVIQRMLAGVGRAIRNSGDRVMRRRAARS